MRPVGVWLERFRRPAGVPAAAGDEIESELMPVFARLDEIEEEARVRRVEAEREVGLRLDRAAAEAEHVLAGWEAQAQAERGRAEAERWAALTSEARAIQLAAELEAAHLLERGRQRIPALVASIIACLVEEDT